MLSDILSCATPQTVQYIVLVWDWCCTVVDDVGLAGFKSRVVASLLARSLCFCFPLFYLSLPSLLGLILGAFFTGEQWMDYMCTVRLGREVAISE